MAYTPVTLHTLEDFIKWAYNNTGLMASLYNKATTPQGTSSVDEFIRYAEAVLAPVTEIHQGGIYLSKGVTAFFDVLCMRQADFLTEMVKLIKSQGGFPFSVHSSGGSSDTLLVDTQAISLIDFDEVDGVDAMKVYLSIDPQRCFWFRFEFDPKRPYSVFLPDDAIAEIANNDPAFQRMLENIATVFTVQYRIDVDVSINDISAETHRKFIRVLLKSHIIDYFASICFTIFVEDQTRFLGIGDPVFDDLCRSGTTTGLSMTYYISGMETNLSFTKRKIDGVTVTIGSDFIMFMFEPTKSHSMPKLSLLKSIPFIKTTIESASDFNVAPIIKRLYSK